MNILVFDRHSTILAIACMHQFDGPIITTKWTQEMITRDLRTII